jgi:hypothetical protein
MLFDMIFWNKNVEDFAEEIVGLIAKTKDGKTIHFGEDEIREGWTVFFKKEDHYHLVVVGAANNSLLVAKVEYENKDGTTWHHKHLMGLTVMPSRKRQR